MMDKVNALREKALPTTLTLLRITVGIVMVAHGWMKLTHVGEWAGNLAHLGVPAPEIAVWLAIAGELGGGLGLVLGLFTPLAALGVFFSMLVAILSAHVQNGLLAKDGGFEYPLVVMMAAAFLAARGGGPFSLDSLIRKVRGRGARRAGRPRREALSAA